MSGLIQRTSQHQQLQFCETLALSRLIRRENCKSGPQRQREQHCRERVVAGSYDLERLGRRQAIGTARFGQEAKVGVARLNMCARTEVFPKTQPLRPSLKRILDARNLTAAQERRLNTASPLVCKCLLFLVISSEESIMHKQEPQFMDSYCSRQAVRSNCETASQSALWRSMSVPAREDLSCST